MKLLDLEIDNKDMARGGKESIVCVGLLPVTEGPLAGDDYVQIDTQLSAKANGEFNRILTNEDMSRNSIIAKKLIRRATVVDVDMTVVIIDEDGKETRHEPEQKIQIESTGIIT